MRICNKCIISKHESCFDKQARIKDGLSHVCKECKAYERRNYRQKNKRLILEYRRNYYKKNSEKICKETTEYYLKNKERLCEINKEWKIKNRDRVNFLNRNNYSRKMTSDCFFKFKRSTSRRILSAIKRRGWKKESSTFSILGADYDVVKRHIERQFKKGMTWDNHGHLGNVWHIDHKIPVSSAKTKEDFINLLHYTNLQPL